MRYLIFAFFLLFFYSCDEISTNDALSLSGDGIIGFNNGQIGDSCLAELETIDSSRLIQSTTVGFTNSFLAPTSCSDSYSPDKIYKVVVTETKKFTAEIINSDFDSVLYLKRTCESDAIICNDDKIIMIFKVKSLEFLKLESIFL